MSKPEEVIDIKKGSLLPFPFQVFGVILVLGGIALTQITLLFSLIPIVIGVVIVTAYEGIRIDRSLKSIQEYNCLLFMKFGKFIPYQSVEKIFMNSGRQSQTMSTAHTTKSSTFRTQVYNAYLKLDDGTKIHLLTKKKKESLVARIQPVAVFLNTELSDVTHVTG